MPRARVAAFAAGLALVAASPASAAETRAEYIALVDPICKAANADLEPRGKKAIRDIKGGKLKRAGRTWVDLTKRFERSVDDVAAVPPPPADASIIDQWLSIERRDVAINFKIARALKRANEKRVFQLLDKTFSLELDIRGVIGAYGFKDCG